MSSFAIFDSQGKNLGEGNTAGEVIAEVRKSLCDTTQVRLVEYHAGSTDSQSIQLVPSCSTCGGKANPRNRVKDFYNGKWHTRCECDECKREITALQNED